MSMVQDKAGTIYAATMPEAKILRSRRAKPTSWPRCPTPVTCGRSRSTRQRRRSMPPPGRRERSSVCKRTVRPRFISTATSRTWCLAVADNGDVYAGSSGKALLYRITAPGRATVLYHFAGEEVKARHRQKQRDLRHRKRIWRAARSPSALGRSVARTGRAQHHTASQAGKGTLFRFDTTGRPERMMHHDEFQYTALAHRRRRAAYVGTGAEGRVYSVHDAHVITLQADSDERQIGALFVTGARAYVAGGDRRSFIALSAAVERMQCGRAKCWTPGFARTSARCRGAPQELWSFRRVPATLQHPMRRGAHGAAPLLPPSRVRVAARGPSPARPAAISKRGPLVTRSQGRAQRGAGALRDGERQAGGARSERLQKGTPAKEPHGTRVPSSGGEPAKHDTVVNITWKVDNADNDALRYRVAFRREGQTAWREALKSDEVLTKTEYEWDTLALPEGKYRVRIEASDEPSNPPDQVQRHALESPSVWVDNTPPVFRTLTLTGRRLNARVVDGLGSVTRVEIAVDGHVEWRPIPADGVFDTADEPSMPMFRRWWERDLISSRSVLSML